jgi:hypothetical protein
MLRIPLESTITMHVDALEHQPTLHSRGRERVLSRFHGERSRRDEGHARTRFRKYVRRFADMLVFTALWA